MTVVRTPGEIHLRLGESWGFVPTMGALHEGHLSLVRKAKEENEKVAVSIFVNPTQFGPNEDFTKYPRPIERDLDLCESAGVDLVFNPEVTTMYSSRPTTVVVPEVGELYEGKFRPGHFDGVATVVLKLFNIVRAQRAYFGLKDLQQCSVLKRMVDDLNVPILLQFLETIRESDGLAMSSRNRYLSPEEREKASQISQQLFQIASGISKDYKLTTLLEDATENLTSVGFHIDYLDYVDRTTFKPIASASPTGAVIFAGKIGNTRLIDNVLTLV